MNRRHLASAPERSRRGARTAPGRVRLIGGVLALAGAASIASAAGARAAAEPAGIGGAVVHLPVDQGLAKAHNTKQGYTVNSSILSRNPINAPISAPINICGTAVAILGDARNGCESGTTRQHGR